MKKTVHPPLSTQKLWRTLKAYEINAMIWATTHTYDVSHQNPLETHSDFCHQGGEHMEITPNSTVVKNEWHEQ
jgi:predicted ATP-dependent endonuclease of OLD family